MQKWLVEKQTPYGPEMTKILVLDANPEFEKDEKRVDGMIHAIEEFMRRYLLPPRAPVGMLRPLAWVFDARLQLSKCLGMLMLMMTAGKLPGVRRRPLRRGRGVRALIGACSGHSQAQNCRRELFIGTAFRRRLGLYVSKRQRFRS